MPVYKRAARPTAAFAPADPREPQSSDNDFTVLFERPREPRVTRAAPRASVSPRTVPGPAVRRPIEPPKPAPRPPLLERASPRGEPASEPQRETPLGMAVGPAGGASLSPMPPIETVAIAPRLRHRVLRVAALFALGGALGVGVELLAHEDRPSSRPEPAAQAAAPFEVTIHETPPVSAFPIAPAASVGGDDKAAVAPPPHRHHVHHPGAQAAASSATAASDPDAGAEGDDVAAAVEALTKAKEEVSLP